MIHHSTESILFLWSSKNHQKLFVCCIFSVLYERHKCQVSWINWIFNSSAVWLLHFVWFKDVVDSINWTLLQMNGQSLNWNVPILINFDSIRIVINSLDSLTLHSSTKFLLWFWLFLNNIFDFTILVIKRNHLSMCCKIIFHCHDCKIELKKNNNFENRLYIDCVRISIVRIHIPIAIETIMWLDLWF